MIPPFYSQILPKEILDLPLSESTASCGSCIMAKPVNDPHRSQAQVQAYFRKKQGRYGSNLKCCTFHPFLPNYVVGAILSDSSDKNRFGREVLEKRLQKRKQILPLGVPAPREYQLEFLQNKIRFGQMDDLLCPYFDQEKNQCGFWIYRGSVCTSFFCASDHSWGLQFWDELVLYLSLVEMSLSELVLERRGVSSREMMRGFDLIDLGKMRSSERDAQSLSELRRLQRSQLWKNHESPESFYKECYQEVLKISQGDLDEALGEVLINQKKSVLSKFKGYRTKRTGDH